MHTDYLWAGGNSRMKYLLFPGSGIHIKTELLYLQNDGFYQVKNMISQEFGAVPNNVTGGRNLKILF
jgi:hypothetical protein